MPSRLLYYWNQWPLQSENFVTVSAQSSDYIMYNHTTGFGALIDRPFNETVLGRNYTSDYFRDSSEKGSLGLLVCVDVDLLAPTYPTPFAAMNLIPESTLIRDECLVPVNTSNYVVEFGTEMINKTLNVLLYGSAIPLFNRSHCSHGQSMFGFSCQLGITENHMNSSDNGVLYLEAFKSVGCVESQEDLTYEMDPQPFLTEGPYYKDDEGNVIATKRFTGDCELSETTKGFVIECADQFTKEITISNTLTLRYNMTDYFIYEWPEAWTEISYSVLIQLFLNSELVGYWDLLTPVASECHHVDCFFCARNLDNFHCMSTQNQIAVVMIILFLMLAVICLLMVIFFFLRESYCSCPQIQFVRTDTKPLTSTDVATMCLLCVLICSPASACDQSFVLTSNAESCIKSGGNLTCVLNTNFDITLVNPGSKYCGVLIDPSTKLIISTINITYSALHRVAQTTLKYYTSNFQYHTASAKYCGDTQHCTPSDNCATNLHLADGGGALSGVATQLPGYIGCDDACGCAACRCVSCNEACVYSRWAVEPVESYYRVNQIASTMLVPTVEICYELNGTKPCWMYSLLPSSNFEAGAFRLMSTSVSSPYTDHLTNDIVYGIDANEGFYAPTSPVGSPTAGLIGEIQSNSASTLREGSPSGVKVAQGLCSRSLSDAAAVFVCSQPAVMFSNHYPQIPGYINNLYWSMHDQNVVMALDQRESIVTMRLSSHTQATLTTVINEVCPTIVASGVVIGCYNCPSGAEMEVIAKSDCHSGRCLLSTDTLAVSLGQSYLELGPSNSNYWIKFTSNTKRGAFTLTCQSGQHVSSTTIEFDLTDPSPLPPTGNQTVILPPPGSFNGWFDDLSIGGKIGLIIGWIIGVIVLLFLTYLTFLGAPILCKYIRDKLAYSRLAESKSDMTEEDMISEDVKQQFIDDIELDDLPEYRASVEPGPVEMRIKPFQPTRTSMF